MYVCMYVCIYIYIWYTQLYLYIYIYILLSLSLSIYIYIYYYIYLYNMLQAAACRGASRAASLHMTYSGNVLLLFCIVCFVYLGFIGECHVFAMHCIFVGPPNHLDQRQNIAHHKSTPQKSSYIHIYIYIYIYIFMHMYTYIYIYV